MMTIKEFLVVTLTKALALSFLFVPPGRASDLVAVHLFTGVNPQRRINFLGPALIKFGQSELSVGHSFAIEQKQAALLSLATDHAPDQPLRFRACIISAIANRPISVVIDLPHFRVHQYLGQLELSVERHGGIRIINRLSRRDYVNSVVASEAPPSAPAEMLKAQALLVQTLLAWQSEKTVLDDSTQFERYAGYVPGRPEVLAAVSSVWGGRILYRGKPIQVFFHSTCAGGTSSAAQYFHLRPGSLPYLRAVTCDYCKDSPFYRETRARMPSSLVNNLSAGAPPAVLSRDRSGRPLTIKLGRHTLSGYDFWIRFGQKYGWDKIPGTRFTIDQEPDGQTVFSSTGAGHGVGLCQWGAIALAKTGKTYRQILQHYFPDCTVDLGAAGDLGWCHKRHRNFGN
jgi:stage II sporulation protein D